jgi:hypothetical protein
MLAGANLWSKIVPCVVVLATATLIVPLIAIPAWHSGKRLEDEHRFLRTYRVPYDSEAYISTSAEYAATSSAPNEVVFFGGSTCLTGIQTRQFEELTGLSAYNLGAWGMIGIEGYKVLVQTYLAHHPSPRVVVLCLSRSEVLSPGSGSTPKKAVAASRSHSIADRFLWCYGQEGAYPRPSHVGPLKYFVSQGVLVALGELSGGERHYLGTRAWSLGGLSYEGFRDSLGKSKGFLSLGTTLEEEPLEPAVRLSSVEAARTVSPEFDLGIRALAKTVAGKGALLLIRFTPEPQICSSQEIDVIRDWFGQLESDCPHVVGDRPEVLLFARDCFGLTSHCNLRGAEKFTALVAPKVVQALQTASGGDSTNSISAGPKTPSEPNTDRATP